MSELMQARQAAGVPLGNVFQVEAGNSGEYHLVLPLVSLAELDDAVSPMEPA